MQIEELKPLFDSYVAQFNDMKYFERDPVAVVRKYSEPLDIEVMGVLCSWLAYGNRTQIVKKCEALSCLLGEAPYDYMMSGTWTRYRGSNDNLYRLFTYNDFYLLMKALRSVYAQHHSLENMIVSAQTDDYISVITQNIAAPGIPKNTSSACKRLALFLRWMVRRDKIVDLGIWQRLDPANLIIPLDVHVMNISHRYGLMAGITPSMSAAQQLTSAAKKLYPSDPAVLDFALFGADFYEKNL